MSMRHVLLMTLLLATALTAAAEESPIPQLGAHTFIPVTALTEPFIRTNVQTSISLGKSVNVEVPILDLEGDTIIGSAEADLILAGIGFRYQHAAKDWLAVRFSMGTAGRLGTSTSSLLAEGITGSVGYQLDWLIRLYRTDRFILSGSMGLGNQSATFINLLDWMEGITDGSSYPLVRSRK